LNDGLEIAVRYNPDSGFYFGVSTSSKISQEHKERIINLINAHAGKYRMTGWMYIHKTFSNNISFKNFNQNLAFQLISQEKNQELVAATWADIEELIADWHSLEIPVPVN
jgi:hypothetical protein